MKTILSTLILGVYLLVSGQQSAAMSCRDESARTQNLGLQKDWDSGYRLVSGDKNNPAMVTVVAEKNFHTLSKKQKASLLDGVKLSGRTDPIGVATPSNKIRTAIGIVIAKIVDTVFKRKRARFVKDWTPFESELAGLVASIPKKGVGATDFAFSKITLSDGRVFKGEQILEIYNQLLGTKKKGPSKPNPVTEVEVNLEKGFEATLHDRLATGYNIAVNSSLPALVATLPMEGGTLVTTTRVILGSLYVVSLAYQLASEVSYEAINQKAYSPRAKKIRDILFYYSPKEFGQYPVTEQARGIYHHRARNISRNIDKTLKENPHHDQILVLVEEGQVMPVLNELMHQYGYTP